MESIPARPGLGPAGAWNSVASATALLGSLRQAQQWRLARHSWEQLQVLCCGKNHRKTIGKPIGKCWFIGIFRGIYPLVMEHSELENHHVQWK